MKKLPRFKNEDAERAFWKTHDATEFIDLSRGEVAIFPELRPSAKTISIRLPESLLDAIKVMAHQQDVPYQSLMKVLLAEAVERKSSRGSLPRRQKKPVDEGGE
jgi:predicted DNA binding CopG/RHH family protein